MNRYLEDSLTFAALMALFCAGIFIAIGFSA